MYGCWAQKLSGSRKCIGQLKCENPLRLREQRWHWHASQGEKDLHGPRFPPPPPTFRSTLVISTADLKIVQLTVIVIPTFIMSTTVAIVISMILLLLLLVVLPTMTIDYVYLYDGHAIGYITTSRTVSIVATAITMTITISLTGAIASTVTIPATSYY